MPEIKDTFYESYNEALKQCNIQCDAAVKNQMEEYCRVVFSAIADLSIEDGVKTLLDNIKISDNEITIRGASFNIKTLKAKFITSEVPIKKIAAEIEPL